jgi:branched-chain amino acid transport system ATP-binding protein
MSDPILVVRDLMKRFGGLTAVDKVSFELESGEILAIIGPNGAGKTTTFNLIAGAMPPTAGDIFFAGQSILGLPAHRIARAGIMRTFQHNMAFPSMSILDNALVGAHTRMTTRLYQIMLGTLRATNEEEAQRAEGLEALRRVGLGDYAEADVNILSFGQGRLLEIARALVSRPRVILFDEPAAGLTPSEALQLAEIIREVARSGIAALVIEHDMKFLLPLAHRVVVLNFGRKIADGAPAAIRADPAVAAAYLGDD